MLISWRVMDVTVMVCNGKWLMACLNHCWWNLPLFVAGSLEQPRFKSEDMMRGVHGIHNGISWDL